jgi:hypothetical protein
MEDGRCTKRFPKPFRDNTSMDKNGYPEYYRPDDGRAYDVAGFMADNSWIIPYNTGSNTNAPSFAFDAPFAGWTTSP